MPGPFGETVTGAMKNRVQEAIAPKQKKRKRPSELAKERAQKRGESEASPGQELMKTVLGSVNEGLSRTKSPETAPVRGLVSGALAGASIGEAVKKYKKRKAQKSMMDDAQ